MVSYKCTVGYGELKVKSRLSSEEQINPRELELLSGGMRGIMRVRQGRFGRLIFEAPEAEPLKRYLMRGLTKEEFASVVAQLVRVLKLIERSTLQMRNLELRVENVYMTPKTRELIFIYRPVINKSASSDLNGFIRSLIEYATFSTLEDRTYVTELEGILRDIEKFPPKTMADYVCRLDKATYDRELAYSDRKQFGGKIDPETGLFEIYDSFSSESGAEPATAVYDEEDEAAPAAGRYEDQLTGTWDDEPLNSPIFAERPADKRKAPESKPSYAYGYSELQTTVECDYDAEDKTDVSAASDAPSYAYGYSEPQTTVECDYDAEDKTDVSAVSEDSAYAYGYSEPQTTVECDYDAEDKTDMSSQRYAPRYGGYTEPQTTLSSDYDAPRYASSQNRRWASPAVRATVERCSTGEVYAIKHEEVLIGKDKLGADIYIDGNPAVSRRHALISSRGGRFYITDMKSLNHTFINGREIPAETEIEIFNGNRLCLADENFIFRTR